MATIAVYAVGLHLRRRPPEQVLLAVVQVVSGVLATERHGVPALTVAALVWLVMVGRFAHEVREHQLTASRSS
jgi:hypothetical protein